MKRHSIRNKVVVTALMVTFFGFLFCGIFSSIFFFGIMKKQVLQDEKQKLNQTAAQLYTIQDEMQQLAKSIAANPEIQKRILRGTTQDVFDFLADKQEIEKIFFQYLTIRSSSYSVVMLTERSNYFSSHGQNEEDITNRDWYLNWKKQGRTKGFTKVHDNKDKIMAISYIMAFYDMTLASRQLGDIIIHIRFEELAKALQMDHGILKSLTLTDGSGALLWSQGDLEPSGRNSTITQDRSLPDGWTLTAEISDLKVLYKLRYIFIFFILLFLSVLLLLGAVLIQIMRKVLKPIDLLVAGTKEVGKGNLDCRVTIDTNDEFKVLSETFNTMVSDIRQYLNDMIAYEKTAKEMEINRLMLQINPHFIYNTLNSIVYMAQIQGNQDIVIFSKAFISLLHDTLNVEKDDIFISLEQEITNMKHYIVLQSYRYTGKFEVCWKVEKACLNAKVPNVFIQPLVENAIYHGLCGKSGKGLLTITAELTDKNHLLLCVEDDGMGMTKEKAEQLIHQNFKMEGGMRKIGIANIRERIRYIYGSDYGMQIKSEENSGTKITIEIPYQPITRRKNEHE